MGVVLCNPYSACRPRPPATQHGAARLRAPLAVPLLLLAVICFAVHGVGPASAQPPPPPPLTPPRFVPRPEYPFPPGGASPESLNEFTYMHTYMHAYEAGTRTRRGCSNANLLDELRAK